MSDYDSIRKSLESDLKRNVLNLFHLTPEPEEFSFEHQGQLYRVSRDNKNTRTRVSKAIEKSILREEGRVSNNVVLAATAAVMEVL